VDVTSSSESSRHTGSSSNGKTKKGNKPTALDVIHPGNIKTTIRSPFLSKHKDTGPKSPPLDKSHNVMPNIGSPITKVSY
jgi:hypothetical protein